MSNSIRHVVGYAHPEPVDDDHAALMDRVTELDILRAGYHARGDAAKVAEINAELDTLFARHDEVMRAAGRHPEQRQAEEPPSAD